jgi:Yip1-like protein
MAMSVDVQATSADAGLMSRAVGVLTSPRETFAGVVAKPRWIGMMALVTIVGATLLFAFVSTPVGSQAMIDQQVQRAEARGAPMSDAQLAQMERVMGIFKYAIPASVLIIGPLFAALIAGILYAVFNVGLGGDATYKQVLAVVVHANVVSMLQQIFTIPLNYFRESMSSATTLGVFVPMLDERSFVARFLGMIDLFFLWWIFVLAIGLAVLYRKRTQPIAVSLYAVYVVIVLAIAGVMSML